MANYIITKFSLLYYFVATLSLIFYY